MVCSDCEKKMDKLIVPDKWRDGARNVTRSANEEGERRDINDNRMLKNIQHSKRVLKNDPMGKTCRLCKTQIERWANYCASCAFKKGICARCGKKVQDTKFARMSNV